MTDLLGAAIDATVHPVAAPTSIHEGWVSDPEIADASLVEATGRGWDAWVAIIDAGPASGADHTAIADWVKAETDIVSWWWAQAVTIGYERITGLRLPGQMKDGTFTVSRTRTLSVDVASARETFEDAGRLAQSDPGLTLTRVSKPGVKTPRFSAADATGTPLGSVTFTADPAKSGAKLTVTHEKLPTAQAADAWKAYWAEWISRL
ncbi:hypothetical protein [Demequina sp. NBRC 110055]|uniref:hypothetical protein n=1 Tax=Demequina sp. NBRC 110055 TaxID=1570344 RepID=UPI0009FC9E27|nr:hypothetical protein [Demequina sp. NBRC 110055]